MIVSAISICEKSAGTSLPSPSIRGLTNKFNKGGKAATAVYKNDSLKKFLIIQFHSSNKRVNLV